MNYISTRGAAPTLPFDDVLLTGLASDGGLYVPETWPAITPADLEAWADLSYRELAFRVLHPFIGGSIADDDLEGIIDRAYAAFDDPDVAPIKDLGDGLHLMELFHGPTLAFKDVAMQFLGHAFDHVLQAKDQRVVIIGATSGDTGSAAIEACRGRDAIEVFMLHPHGRVSEVQRRQMTTVLAPNIHNIAIDGTFDDCQDLVKAAFNDAPFRARHPLSAVNSINWARVVAQIVYYVWASLRTAGPGGPCAFAVPTGNFGNVLAAYAARQMGLPVSQLVVGSNRNDILTRFFDTGAMQMGEVHPTLSPSMDIQVSSNFERLLFDLLDRDGAACTETMDRFRASGRFEVSEATLARARVLFDSAAYDDEATKATIRRFFELHGETLDPHSAVGAAAALDRRREEAVPMVVVATAHPAKFPDAVEAATGERPALPAHLSDLLEREERCTRLANDLGALESLIDETLT